MLDRVVAGLTCRDVLERLRDYLAGEIGEREVERVEAHLAGCDQCARFGGAYAKVCADLRETLAEPEPPSTTQLDRLRARLDADLARDEV